MEVKDTMRIMTQEQLDEINKQMLKEKLGNYIERAKEVINTQNTKEEEKKAKKKKDAEKQQIEENIRRILEKKRSELQKTHRLYAGLDEHTRFFVVCLPNTDVLRMAQVLGELPLGESGWVKVKQAITETLQNT